MRLVINIPAQQHEVELDESDLADLQDEETGGINYDYLYDGYIHEYVSNPKYTYELKE